MKYIITLYSIAFCLGLIPSYLHATHIKAANLSAILNPDHVKTVEAYRNVRFTLNVFCEKSMVDESGTSDSCGGMLGNCAVLSFGDGKKSVQHYVSKTLVNSTTYQFVYSFDHTYLTDDFFTVSYSDDNRRSEILNLQAPSDHLPFYIEMGVMVASGLKNNHTPIASVPLLGAAELSKRFVYNAGMFDSDGDSISYYLTKPKIDSVTYAPYQDPNVTAGGTMQDSAAAAIYTLNPMTGDIIWDAPGKMGMYDLAYVVEEWRTVGETKVRLSYAMVDMLAEVLVDGDHPPHIETPIPDNYCINAGDTLNFSISMSDEDGDTARIKLLGELSTSSGHEFSVEPGDLVASKNTKKFTWKTQCSEIRKGPYQLAIKVAEIRSPFLTDVKLMTVKVLPPPINELRSFIENDSVLLKWQPYACNATATGFLVYRKEGVCDSFDLLKNTGPCPKYRPISGYSLIASVPASDTIFKDFISRQEGYYGYVLTAFQVDENGDTLFSRMKENHTCMYYLPTSLETNEVSTSTEINAYPNPFQSQTTLQYYMSQEAYQKLQILDVLGNPLKVVSEGFQEAGSQETLLDLSAFPSGIYFYQLTIGDRSKMGRLVKR